MIKVLHLTTHLDPGGITVYILRLIDGLKEYGFESSVFSGGGEYGALFKGKEAKTVECPIRVKSILAPKLWGQLPALIRMIRREQYSLLHAHTRVTQALALAAGKFTGVPVVTTCHGFYRRRLGRVLVPAWGDLTIAISEPVATHLHSDFRVPLSKIRVVPNGVDAESLTRACQSYSPNAAKRAFGFHPRDFVIGNISRLVQDKGQRYLIEAVDRLRTEFDNIRLLLVGDGRTRNALRELADDYALRDHVVFTGNLPDVTEALAAMDLFAFPATWREGFGLSIIEAMAFGKPVIVSDIPALNSIIQDRVTGIIVPPKEADRLAEEISNLITDKELRSQIAFNGQSHAIKFFTIPRMVKGIVETYQHVLTMEKS